VSYRRWLLLHGPRAGMRCNRSNMIDMRMREYDERLGDGLVEAHAHVNYHAQPIRRKHDCRSIPSHRPAKGVKQGPDWNGSTIGVASRAFLRSFLNLLAIDPVGLTLGAHQFHTKSTWESMVTSHGGRTTSWILLWLCTQETENPEPCGWHSKHVQARFDIDCVRSLIGMIQNLSVCV